MASQNLIHRVNLDLKIITDNNSFDYANELVDQYKNSVLEVIKQFFEDFETEKLILIEQITIDIENVSSISELKDRLFRQLQQQCSTFLDQQFNHIDEIKSLNKQDHTEEVLTLLEINDVLYFLANGQFKWVSHRDIFGNKENKKLVNSLVSRYFESLNYESLFEYFLAFPFAIFRIKYYFPQLWKVIIAKFISPNQLFTSKEYTYLVEQISNNLIILEKLFNRNYTIKFFKFLQAFYRQNSNPIDLTFFFLIIRDYSFPTLLEVIVKGEESIFNLFKEIKTNKHHYFKSFNTSSRSELNEYLFEDSFKRIIAYGRDDLVEIEDLINLKLAKSEDSNLINHFKYCGIVFLHPFITRLFRKQKLLKNNAFVDFESKIKAIYLLYYMATYKTKAMEEDFLFFKLLVGLSSDIYIPTNFELSDSELENCRFQLKELIKEWTILKRTTEDTIQLNFLQRNGMVRLEERSMEIYLEKSAFNVLLEHFPYNHSLIKFPWQEKLIYLIV